MDAELVTLFIELVERYSRGEMLSPTELALMEWGLDDPACKNALEQHMERILQAEHLVKETDKAHLSGDREQALARLLKKLEQDASGNVPKAMGLASSETSPPRGSSPVIRDKGNWHKYISIAAVIIFLMGAAALWVLLAGRKSGTQNLANNTAHYQRIIPILPGSSGAILTLSNGRKIALGSNHKSLLHIGGLTIQPGKDAAKLSNAGTAQAGTEVLYNILTTPRGKQYQIELPDGTKVWLNASSTLRFPTVFNQQNRTVELSGEAYFEVVHNQDHPFQVKVKNQLIEDIGTKFNVKAYSDESSVRTSLVEGIVDVSNGVRTLRLNPGQAVKAGISDMSVYKADLSQVLAWKSGFFAFQKASVEEIMRQLSRWYDVDIAYNNSFDKQQASGQLFTGSIDRNLDLQDVLDGLQFSQVHFKIDKNKRTIIIEN